VTKDPRVYLAHILERAGRIDAYVRDGEPWQLMAGFRDVLIHGYEGVDIGRVWITATRDLPVVRAAILAILPPLDQLERELAGDEDGRQQE
jgi:uncharacterized protein with HEPN domain